MDGVAATLIDSQEILRMTQISGSNNQLPLLVKGGPYFELDIPNRDSFVRPTPVAAVGARAGDFL